VIATAYKMVGHVSRVLQERFFAKLHLRKDLREMDDGEHARLTTSRILERITLDSIQDLKILDINRIKLIN